MTKCIGCGALLQTSDSNQEGYVISLEKELCERCFRIKNYNDYQVIMKDNTDYFPILEKISKTDDLVLFVIDILSIPSVLKDMVERISNNKILVLTKRDLLPKDIYEDKIINYLNYDFIDKVIVSAKNNYNLDLLMEKIKKHQTSNHVYVVGFTNAGKSSLINKIIYNYTDLKKELTTSNLPSTTIDTIFLDINDNLTLIDTPGIIDEGNILNFVDGQTIKKIIPSKPLKPIIYQVKVKQNFFVDNLCRIDIDSSNDLVFYFAPSLKIDRFYKDSDKLKNLEKHIISVPYKNDIVITGLGFVKVMKATVLTIYTIKGVKVFTRPSIL